jgi:hypothetical protein
VTRTQPNEAVDKLQAMATLFDDAAARAFTVIDHEQRQQDARTLRVVAGMAADRTDPFMRRADAAWIALWLESAERLLAYYDRADMDVVYASRAARRVMRAAELGTEARA